MGRSKYHQSPLLLVLLAIIVASSDSRLLAESRFVAVDYEYKIEINTTDAIASLEQGVQAFEKATYGRLEAMLDKESLVQVHEITTTIGGKNLESRYSLRLVEAYSLQSWVLTKIFSSLLFDRNMPTSTNEQ